VSVIVNREAGSAIEEEMKSKADFSQDSQGNMFSADKYLVEILGGVEAVQALNGDDFDDEDDEDGKENGLPVKKRKSHHLNPMHSDGLHDFVGIGYVVDEVLHTRFSIFPSEAVSIGSTWERTMLLSDHIDPTVQAVVTEKYRLVSLQRAEFRQMPWVERGDFIAEIEVIAKEKPAPIPPKPKEERLPINPDPNEEVDDGKKITPQFARPSFRGHEFSTKGMLQVHVPTGFVLTGHATSEASSERTVVVINKKTKKRKTVKAKVDIVANTEYGGIINPQLR
jgi:hypothetical protein